MLLKIKNSLPTRPVNKMKHSTFISLMAGLLKKFNLPQPENLSHAVCCVSFENLPDISFINHIPDYIDVVCHVGGLPPDTDAATLIDLLALNSFDRDDNHIMVTVHPPSGTITLLGRKKIAETNVSVLMQLTENVYTKYEMIKALVSRSGNFDNIAI